MTDDHLTAATRAALQRRVVEARGLTSSEARALVRARTERPGRHLEWAAELRQLKASTRFRSYWLTSRPYTCPHCRRVA